MWLLDVGTRQLEHFIDERQVIGKYAILSHTWGDEEVRFDEIHLSAARHKKGYRKIDYTCRQAAKDGYRFAWIDTCCIDKRSSAELSEAINSMYRWYCEAGVCYAFLSDVQVDSIRQPDLKDVTCSFKDLRHTDNAFAMQPLSHANVQAAIILDQADSHDDAYASYGELLVTIEHMINSESLMDQQQFLSLAFVLFELQRLNRVVQKRRLAIGKTPSTRIDSPEFSQLSILQSALQQRALQLISQLCPRSGITRTHINFDHTASSDISRFCYRAPDGALRPSKWFTRGWTLQELIAPNQVAFYDSMWRPLGPKSYYVEAIHFLTGIHVEVLNDRNALQHTSVAQRLSWASYRITSREEDMAYCLFGILDVNMSLLYGEGSKAFLRLQEEVVRAHESPDHSILVWPSDAGDLLASSPAVFSRQMNLLNCNIPQRQTFELSNRGLRLTVYVRPSNSRGGQAPSNSVVDDASALTAVLDCWDAVKRMHPALILRRRPVVRKISRALYAAGAVGDTAGLEEEVYERTAHMDMISSNELSQFAKKTLTIARKAWVWPQCPNKVRISPSSANISHFAPASVAYDHVVYDEETRVLVLPDYYGVHICFDVANSTDRILKTCWIGLSQLSGSMPVARVKMSSDADVLPLALQAGTEKILFTNDSMIVKVVGNIVAYENELLWELDFTASIVYELAYKGL